MQTFKQIFLNLLLVIFADLARKVKNNFLGSLLNYLVKKLRTKISWEGDLVCLSAQTQIMFVLAMCGLYSKSC